MSNTIICTALATIALAATSPSASANTYTTYVSFADLDVSTKVGMDELEDRITDAARNLCRHRSPILAYQNRPLSTCVRRIEESVEPQLIPLREQRHGTVETVTIKTEIEPRG